MYDSASLWNLSVQLRPAASTSVVKSPKVKVGLQLWNVVLFQLSSVIPHCDTVAVIHLLPIARC
jgi:hypothetical protein